MMRFAGSFALVFQCVLLLAACGGSETSVGDGADTTAPTSSTNTAPLATATGPAALTVGSPAPAFELPGSDGNTHRLDAYAGQHVVVAFFPKAFTGG